MKATYVQTRAGVISCSYKGQKFRTKERDDAPLEFSKKELEEWAYKNGFQEVYNDYQDSNFDKWKRPSFDRINSNLGYFFDNMELVTWRENRDRQTRDFHTGTGSSGKLCKAIRCIGTDLNAVFVSRSSAIRIVGYNMFYQLKTGRPDRNGRRWEYVK